MIGAWVRILLPPFNTAYIVLICGVYFAPLPNGKARGFDPLIYRFDSCRGSTGRWTHRWESYTKGVGTMAVAYGGLGRSNLGEALMLGVEDYLHSSNCTVMSQRRIRDDEEIK